MGLDMFAFARQKQAHADLAIHRAKWMAIAATGKDPKDELEVFQLDGKQEQLHYWRKHHDLHGWMQKLYAEKSGINEPQDFNCQEMELTLQDLARLEADLIGAALPETSGFFFGCNPPDEDSLADDMDFIRKARAAIADDKVVIYDSWW